MSTEKINYEEAKEITEEWGYEDFTKLQDMVFQNCACWENAREFIIGSTSSGKTLIPLVCYKVDKRRYEKKVKLLYLIPYKALATQKEKEFIHKFPEEKVIISTSEYCSEDVNVMEGNCDIAIVIYEKVFMFLSKNKHFLDQYTHIVFDELGIVEHPERGLKVDYILYMACNHSKSNIYVLATPYFNWELYISQYSFHKHQEESMPIEIRENIIDFEFGERGQECDKQNEIILNLCDKHRSLGHKILIFVNSRDRVRDLSRKIYSHFSDAREKISDGEAKHQFLSKLAMTDDDLYGIMDKDDYLAYSAGIAYHNASLPEEVRELIENDFLNDDGMLDIVVATETLAYGLNSNVDVVIVTEMEKPIGRGRREFLTVNEYKNYIGRAGRLGKTLIGYAYTFVEKLQNEKWNELKQKIKAPDMIESQYGDLWGKEECIFHLLNYFDNPGGTEIKDVLNRLTSFPYHHNNEKINMGDYVTALKERKLIKDAENELDDIKKMQVSKIGKRVLGFIISIETYDRLIKATEMLSKSEEIYIFDFLYAICHCKELQIKDYYSPHDARNYRSHLIQWLDKMVRDGQATERCKTSITNNPLIEKFKNENNRFGYKEFDMLRRVRMAEALYMWMECYSIKEIQKICRFEYGTIKKMGEKAKYITDILSADISMSREIGRHEIYFKQTGLSLFYGIKRELVSELNLLELEPVQGRQLRTIGRIRNISEHYSKSKSHRLEMLKEHISSFPEEYKVLVEDC